MLVVKTELWPFGDEEFAETLSTVVIGNDATGTPVVGSYRVWYEKGDVDPHVVRRNEPDAYVGSHVRASGHLALVGKAMKAVGVLVRA